MRGLEGADVQPGPGRMGLDARSLGPVLRVNGALVKGAFSALQLGLGTFSQVS